MPRKVKCLLARRVGPHFLLFLSSLVVPGAEICSKYERTRASQTDRWAAFVMFAISRFQPSSFIVA